MPSLKEHFAAIPREYDGSRTSNRIDYQKSWALCHLLELHDSRADYALAVERHDDVAVLDCPLEPKRVDFYQLKTKDDGDWKLARLLYVEKRKAEAASAPVEKKMSHLAKLYGNRLACPECEVTASFVSNARFAFKLANGEDGTARTEICFSELSTEDLGKILAQLRGEHGLTEDPDCVSMFFRRSEMGVLDHPLCAQGMLAEFLDKHQLGDAQSVMAFYRALYAEIVRRTNHETEPGSFEAVIRRKAITRAEFQAMLDTLRNSRDFESITAQVSSHLQQDGLPFTAIRAILRDCRQVFLQRRGNKLPKALFAACEQIIHGITSHRDDHTLRALLELGVIQVKARNVPGAELFQDSYLSALLLLAIYEY